jgi:hypothetical protein
LWNFPGAKKLAQIRENSNFFREQLRKMGCEVLGDPDSPVMPIMLYNPAKIPAFSRECFKRNVCWYYVFSCLLCFLTPHLTDVKVWPYQHSNAWSMAGIRKKISYKIIKLCCRLLLLQLLFQQLHCCYPGRVFVYLLLIQEKIYYEGWRCDASVFFYLPCIKENFMLVFGHWNTLAVSLFAHRWLVKWVTWSIWSIFLPLLMRITWKRSWIEDRK